MVHTKRARLIITLLITILLTAGTSGAIFFARGYRPTLNGTTKIEGTGLLAASSYPEQSSVYIDDKLTTTTNDTLNIYPGLYNVKITKEGFIPWQKPIKIEKELVSLTNARLFPQVPSLTAYTSSGADEASPSPDGLKIAYLVRQTTDSSLESGIYVITASTNLLSFDRRPTLVAKLSPDELKRTGYLWSPDSRQILLYSVDKDRIISSHLLEPDRLNNLNSVPDVTVRLPFIFSEWEKTLIKIETDLIKTLPQFMSDLASSSATNIYFSPDGEKMLYTVQKSISLPENIIPPVDSINPTVQTRDLAPSKIYVYDLKEDTNYLLGDFTATTAARIDKRLITIPIIETTASARAGQVVSKILQDNTPPTQAIDIFKNHYYSHKTLGYVWYPTSRHLITAKDGQITIREYDNTNHSTVYSGPFVPNLVLPSPDGHKLFFLTNLNQPNLPQNLYFLDLK